MDMVLDTFASLFDKYFDYNSDASSQASSTSENQKSFKDALIGSYWGEQEGKTSDQLHFKESDQFQVKTFG
jgi:hypothetical protein